MFLQIADVLSAAQLQAIRDKLAADASFRDGAATAGWQARAVKHNEQAGGEVAEAIIALVRDILLKHPVFKAAALPKTFTKLLVSRYRPGMSYGTHVDEPLMDGIRTDLSFTLFLSDPETYDGGALVVEGNDGDSEIRLPAGSLVLYPTTTLHRVSEVTRGERLAVVGWIRSLVRDDGDREILFDLENLIAALRDMGAPRAVIDRTLKIRANLIRKWAED